MLLFETRKKAKYFSSFPFTSQNKKFTSAHVSESERLAESDVRPAPFDFRKFNSPKRSSMSSDFFRFSNSYQNLKSPLI